MSVLLSWLCLRNLRACSTHGLNKTKKRFQTDLTSPYKACHVRSSRFLYPKWPAVDGRWPCLGPSTIDEQCECQDLEVKKVREAWFESEKYHLQQTEYPKAEATHINHRQCAVADAYGQENPPSRNGWGDFKQPSSVDKMTGKISYQTIQIFSR